MIGNYLKRRYLGLSALLIVAVAIFVSCGKQDDKAPESVYLIQANTTCTQDLKDILTRDITTSLACVRDSVDTFTESVKFETKGYIQRKELTLFIERYFPEDFELARDLLELIYQLNTLFLNDPVDHLKLENIDTIFRIAYLVNDEGRTLKDLLTGIDGDNYWDRRLAIYQNVQLIANELLSMVVPFKDSQRELDILKFLEQVKQVVDLSDDQLDLDSIEAYLFAKKLILGGDRHVLQIDQTIDLLQRTPNLLILAYDTVYSQDKSFANDEEEYYFYFDIIRELSTHYWPADKDPIILDGNDIRYILTDLFADEHDIEPIQESLNRLKRKFISSDSDDYTYSDVTKITDLLDEFLGMLYFDQVTYKSLQRTLRSPNPISSLTRPKLPQYSRFSEKRLDQYWQQFSKIVYNYRYYYNNSGNTIYSSGYKRTAHGLTMTSMMNWGIAKIMDVYGRPVRSDFVAGPKDIDKVMSDAEGILKPFIYWPKDYEGFLTETVTNSDLFQIQSNGDELANTEELTEYLVSVLHSFDISERIHDVLKKTCAIMDEEDQSFEVACFRKYFAKAFFNELSLADYYPQLYRYLRTNGVPEILEYFKNIESYARYTPEDHVPVTEEEITRTLVIISSLEGIYIKYDYNKNNILERNELDDAFLLFRGLIRKVADLGEPDNPLYKSIFLYLVKYMKEPSTLQLSWFHLFTPKDDITSTRFNVAAILNSIL